MSISITLTVNGHTAVVTVETPNDLDSILQRVTEAMKCLPVHYKHTYSPNTLRDNDWGGLRPMNPNTPAPTPDYPWHGPGVVYCGGYMTPISGHQQ